MTGYLQRLMFIMLCGLPVWLLLRRPWKRRPLLREIVMALFILFMAGLLIFALNGQWDAPAVMLRRAQQRIAAMDRIWLKPFNSIVTLSRSTILDEFLINIVGNIVMFIPWGFCLPLLWPRFRSPPAMLLMCLGLTLFIETTQLFIDRYVETDDIILNFIGGISGAGLWWICHRIHSSLLKKRS